MDVLRHSDRDGSILPEANGLRRNDDLQLLSRSVVVRLLRESMSDEAFASYLDRFLEELGCGDHLILGISDTTPPAAEFGRLEEIGQRVEVFGEVGPWLR